ncbi:hypothetical protein B0H14DRAFT_3779365 [Mycena olivaceomarginata]|nr:hypothetical protein B0H14DRAFT_3779365 [Mycena olivaceomarginata]
MTRQFVSVRRDGSACMAASRARAPGGKLGGAAGSGYKWWGRAASAQCIASRAVDEGGGSRHDGAAARRTSEGTEERRMTRRGPREDGWSAFRPEKTKVQQAARRHALLRPALDADTTRGKRESNDGVEGKGRGSLFKLRRLVETGRGLDVDGSEIYENEEKLQRVAGDDAAFRVFVANSLVAAQRERINPRESGEQVSGKIWPDRPEDVGQRCQRIGAKFPDSFVPIVWDNGSGEDKCLYSRCTRSGPKLKKYISLAFCFGEFRGTEAETNIEWDGFGGSGFLACDIDEFHTSFDFRVSIFQK